LPLASPASAIAEAIGENAAQLGEDLLHRRPGDVLDADRERAIERKTRIEQNRKLADRVDDAAPRRRVHAQLRALARLRRSFDRFDRHQAEALDAFDGVGLGRAFEHSRPQLAGRRRGAIFVGGHDQTSRVARRTSSIVVRPCCDFMMPSASMVRIP
jgi:hypothetical protein